MLHIIVFFSSSLQTIVKKTTNKISRFPFIYKIIVVYSLVAIRITKVNTIATIVVAILGATNKIKYLDQKYAINC